MIFVGTGAVGPAGPQGDPGNVELGYVETASAFTAGIVAPAVGANANVADVPGMSIAVPTTPNRPFYGWASATGQLGKGTGTTGGLAQIVLAIYDSADMSMPITATAWSTIIQASPLQQGLIILPARINPGAGLAKTYKLTCWAGALPAGNGASLQVPSAAYKIRFGITLG